MKLIHKILSACIGICGVHSIANAVVQDRICAMSTTGDSIEIVADFDGSVYNINVHTLAPLGLWSSATTVGSAPQFVSVQGAVNSLGHAVVLWVTYDTVNSVDTLYMSFYDGISWSLPTALSTATESINGSFGVCLSNADWTLINWQSYDTGTGNFVVRSVIGVLGALSSPVTM